MLRDGFPIIYTADLGSAEAFYRQTLGFAIRYRWPTDGAADFVVLELGAFTLGLAVESAPEALLGREPGKGIRFELCFYADELDELIERLEGNGVPVWRRPQDMPWGERMAYIADPDGNPIQLVMASTAA